MCSRELEVKLKSETILGCKSSIIMPVYLQLLQLNSVLTLWRLKCNVMVDAFFFFMEKFKVLKLKSVDCEQGN